MLQIKIYDNMMQANKRAKYIISSTNGNLVLAMHHTHIMHIIPVYTS
jgi:hypothetical protein